MGVIKISASFWNMRRRLKAQKQNDKVITDLAKAQAEEKAKVEKTTKPKKAGAKKNDSITNKQS